MNQAAAFPRTARLLAAAEFKQVFNARQRIGGRLFVLHWHASGAETARLGLAISRKVDRRAVARNRLKRLIRDSFRLHRHELPALDLVLLARADAPDASNEALRKELTWLWRKLAALPGNRGQGTMPAAPVATDEAPVTPPD
ncbi:ribonuclease P protein component [Pseudomarimonas arenosa]|uniref:Ribonuclease P protein component n=1 Tax=Pseudomarimonas arenosa TaxID=2774145 RepID=A0AAW3ZPW7_9GAMM|nr:ribonuclease P protein component [Pseudomarimonas arenosa]